MPRLRGSPPVQVVRVVVPQAAQSLRQRQSGIHMLDLKSFHIVLIAASIVLMSGLGVWGLLNDYQLLGAIAMAMAVLLVGYFAYFAAGARRVER
jgi:quinol-cytochrome oxidoreductase complex cytochrome b subunit